MFIPNIIYCGKCYCNMFYHCIVINITRICALHKLMNILFHTFLMLSTQHSCAEKCIYKYDVNLNLSYIFFRTCWSYFNKMFLHIAYPPIFCDNELFISLFLSN